MIVEANNPMAAWERGIPAGVYPELKMWASETKQDVPETPESLGLPHYRQLRLPVGVFLSSSDQVIAELSCEKYWFQLTPEPPHKKVTVVDVLSNELRNTVESQSQSYSRKTSLLISEYANNLFGGNIVIGSMGRVVAEFAEGLQSKVASQEIIPEFTVSSSPGTNSLTYSFDDPRLRRAMWQLIRDIRKLPGYYEFTILEGWRPIFLDTRLRNPIYRIADPMQ